MNPVVQRILQRHRNLLLFSAALTCGAVAVYAGSRYVNDQLAQERQRLAPPVQQMVEVVVAATDLEKGEFISAEVMALRQVPATYVPSSAVLPDQFEVLLGQQLQQPLRAGEILAFNAVNAGDALSFSTRIKPGIRALTISVDEINSISGMLQPGDRIDLLLTGRPPASDGQREADRELTVPLLQNLLVMATGRQVRPGADEGVDARSFSAVTVEVSPAQAKRLIVAQTAGKLTAVLRNPEDSSPMDTAAIDPRSLFNLPVQKQAVPVRTRRAPGGPQIIIGGVGQQGMRTLPNYGIPSQALPLRTSALSADERSHQRTSAIGAEAVPGSRDGAHRPTSPTRTLSAVNAADAARASTRNELNP